MIVNWIDEMNQFVFSFLLLIFNSTQIKNLLSNCYTAEPFLRGSFLKLMFVIEKGAASPISTYDIIQQQCVHFVVLLSKYIINFTEYSRFCAEPNEIWFLVL